MNRQPDGSLLLTPRGRVECKSEQGHADGAGVKSEEETPEDKATGAGEQAEDDDTLDQFAKAALDAFRKRKAQRQPVLKKPAAKAKAAMPKLPSCNAKATVVEVDKKNIQAAMPKLPSDGSDPAQ